MNETMNESRVDVARAWKDAAYRAGLSAAERAALPENPAGLMELSDADLMAAEGGRAVPDSGSICLTIFAGTC